MSVVQHPSEEGLRRFRMSWEDYLRLPEKPKAEWVDGEVVVSPPVAVEHGSAVSRLIVQLATFLPDLEVLTEVGVKLPRNRLRGPDVMVVDEWPDGTWVERPPVLVVEVLSPSTRREDLVSKSPEYAEGGVGQYWVVDPEARSIDVYANVDGRWEPVLHLDAAQPAGEVPVGAEGEHGVVPLDLGTILRA